MSTEHTANNPYGAWIDHVGGLHIVVDECQHYTLFSHYEAFKQGFVRVVWASDSLSAELDSETVTLEALTTLAREWRNRALEHMHLEDRNEYSCILNGCEDRETVLKMLRGLRNDVLARNELALAASAQAQVFSLT